MTKSSTFLSATILYVFLLFPNLHASRVVCTREERSLYLYLTSTLLETRPEQGTKTVENLGRYCVTQPADDKKTLGLKFYEKSFTDPTRKFAFTSYNFKEARADYGEFMYYRITFYYPFFQNPAVDNLFPIKNESGEMLSSDEITGSPRSVNSGVVKEMIRNLLALGSRMSLSTALRAFSEQAEKLANNEKELINEDAKSETSQLQFPNDEARDAYRAESAKEQTGYFDARSVTEQLNTLGDLKDNFILKDTFYYMSEGEDSAFFFFIKKAPSSSYKTDFYANTIVVSYNSETKIMNINVNAMPHDDARIAEFNMSPFVFADRAENGDSATANNSDMKFIPDNHHLLLI